MKSAVSFLGCVVRLFGGRVLLAVTIGVFVLGISFTHAQVPSSGTVVINSQAVCGDREKIIKGTAMIPGTGVIEFTDQGQCGPVPGGIGGRTTYSASSTAKFNFFGPVVPELGKAIGTFEGKAVSSMSGDNRNLANGTAQMSLRYYFNIVQIGIPPFPMVTIPISFTFWGEGKVDRGYGTVGLSAFVTGVPGTGFPTNDFKIGGSSGPKSVSINRSVKLNLPVNKPASPYHVIVAGNAIANSPSVFTLKIEDNDVSMASVSVYGTFIRLDQATFTDSCTKQLKTPFPLSDYYRLEFSPNVIVSRL